MRIIPLASDSLGVRSLATLVEFGDGWSLLIDGGARLGPLRYGLPPTALEERTLGRYTSLITACLRRARAVVVSHYHYDHYLPDSPDYEGRIIYAKDPVRGMNRSQQTRGALFLELQRDVARIEIADGRSFRHDDVVVSFTEPVPHGEEDGGLGSVIMTVVEDRATGETLLHTSDVQGPVSFTTADRITDIRPTHLILDGAPTYLQEWQDPLVLERVERNLRSILDSVEGTVIMDHHSLRDREWPSYLTGVHAGERITTFAGYQGTRPCMLESMRKEIWRSEHGKG